MKKYSHKDWKSRAIALFGENVQEWKFICPCCNHIASVKDWVNRKQIAFSCVGRSLPNSRSAFDSGPGPCDYAGGGLFKMNPIEVEYEDGTKQDVFDFATV